MGFFNELGRKVERVKQATANATAEDEYQCQACDARFETDHDQCPKCGSNTVVSTGNE